MLLLYTACGSVTTKNSYAPPTVPADRGESTLERGGGSEPKRLTLPLKLWDVLHMLESTGYRVGHHEPTEDTFYLRGDVRTLYDTVRLTHPLKVIDHHHRLSGRAGGDRVRHRAHAERVPRGR